MISRRRLLQIFAGLSFSAVVLAAYSFLFGPLRWPAITRYKVSPNKWPAGLELTIAIVADIHACEPWMSLERIRSIVDKTNSLGADLIVLLGDYSAGLRLVSGAVSSEEWSAALSSLNAPLGVHAILGNHDWWDDRTAQKAGKGPTYGQRALEGVGIPVYENDAVKLTKGGQSFWLAGLGDQWAFIPSQRQFPGRKMGVDDLDATLAKIPAGESVVLLAHEPDIMVRVPNSVSLVLSGHTHGGQVRLFGWSPVVPSRYGNRYAYGHVRESCDLIVSGGLGCSIAPVRFGVPPEIVFVTVGSAAKAV